MGVFKKLFGRQKKKESITELEFSQEQYDKDYEKKVQRTTKIFPIAGGPMLV